MSSALRRSWKLCSLPGTVGDAFWYARWADHDHDIERRALAAAARSLGCESSTPSRIGIHLVASVADVASAWADTTRRPAAGSASLHRNPCLGVKPGKSGNSVASSVFLPSTPEAQFRRYSRSSACLRPARRCRRGFPPGGRPSRYRRVRVGQASALFLMSAGVAELDQRLVDDVQADHESLFPKSNRDCWASSGVESASAGDIRNQVLSTMLCGALHSTSGPSLIGGPRCALELRCSPNRCCHIRSIWLMVVCRSSFLIAGARCRGGPRPDCHPR